MTLLDEFHSLYRKRLDDCGNSQLRGLILEEYVDDLKAQNKLLFTAVENVENFAMKKISMLEEAKNRECALIQRVDDLENRLEDQLKVADEAKRIALESDNQQSQQPTPSTEELDCLVRENCALKEEIGCLNEKLCLQQDQCERMQNEVNELTATLCSHEIEKSKSEENETDLVSRIQCLEEEKASFIYEQSRKDAMLARYARETTALKKECCEGKKISESYLQLQDEVEMLRAELMKKSCALEEAKTHIEELHCYGRQEAQLSRPTRLNGTGASMSGPPHIQESPERVVKDVGASGDAELSNLRTKLESQRDLQMALTAEVAEKHDTIMSLKEQNHDLEEKLRQTEMQAHFKDDIIKQLRKEVKLGRAKESLAEMLGLKEGPRVQMKARIDLLKSELEDKKCEIDRLNALVERSAVTQLETRAKMLTLDLESRERKLLAMCDKVEYIRNYLHQLKTEEQLSIKCGLEALLTELNEDAESNREVRRNVSISLDKEPNENVIIINHRSHSLPDSALQRQVINFKTATGFNPRNYLHGIPSQSIKFDLDTVSKLKQVAQDLENFQTKLCETWKSMNSRSHVKLVTQLNSILDVVEEDHNRVINVCDHLESFSSSISSLHELSNNSSLSTSSLGSIYNSLETALNNMDNHVYCAKEKEMMKIKEKRYNALKSNISSKTDHHLQKEPVNNNDLEEFEQIRKNLYKVSSNYGFLVQQMTAIIADETSLSKGVLDKYNEIEADLHRLTNSASSIASEFKSLHSPEIKHGESSIPISISNDSAFEEKSCEVELITEAVDSSKCIEVLSSTSGNSIKPSLCVEEKGAAMRNIAASICTEIKHFIRHLIQHDKMILDFKESGTALCESLNQTRNAISNVIIGPNGDANDHTPQLLSLRATLSKTENEAQNLLKHAKAYMMEREMIEALHVKKEQNINNMLTALLNHSTDIIQHIKVSQQEDDKLLNSFSSQISSYKEQVDRLQRQIVDLETSKLAEVEEKLSLKIEHHRSMEDLQHKISSLQAALQDEKDARLNNRSSMWFLPWPLKRKPSRL